MDTEGFHFIFGRKDCELDNGMCHLIYGWNELPEGFYSLSSGRDIYRRLYQGMGTSPNSETVKNHKNKDNFCGPGFAFGRAVTKSGNLSSESQQPIHHV